MCTTERSVTLAILLGVLAALSSPAAAQRVLFDPETEYVLTVEATDACGQLETAALRATTTAAPTTTSLSGWRLGNDHPQFEYTFPASVEIAWTSRDQAQADPGRGARPFAARGWW